jgi:hypothetical protein
MNEKLYKVTNTTTFYVVSSDAAGATSVAQDNLAGESFAGILNVEEINDPNHAFPDEWEDSAPYRCGTTPADSPVITCSEALLLNLRGEEFAPFLKELGVGTIQFVSSFLNKAEGRVECVSFASIMDCDGVEMLACCKKGHSGKGAKNKALDCLKKRLQRLAFTILDPDWTFQK